MTPDASGASFQFFSRRDNAEQQTWRLHAKGRIRYQKSEDTPQAISLETLQKRLSQPMPVAAYYQHLASVGADYGPAFRGIQEIRRADGEALGRIAISDSLLDEIHEYTVHPALLDACFQLTGAALPNAGDLDNAENNIIYVPVGFHQLRVYEKVGNTILCHVQMRSATEQSNAKTLTGDLTLFDQAGRVVAVVDGLLLQQINRQALQRAVQVNIDNWLYEIDWLNQPKGASQGVTTDPGSWLIFADEGNTSKDLMARLEAQGEACYCVFPGDGFVRKDSNHWQIDPLEIENFKQLIKDVNTETKQPLRGIVHLWSLKDILDDQTDLDTLHSIQARDCASVLHVVQALASETKTMPRLWLVTRGAQALDEGLSVNPAASTLWGLGNVIALEQPNLNCVRIDLDPSNAVSSFLFDEIWAPDEEDQVAFRGEGRHVARLVPGDVKSRLHSEASPVALIIQERGVLDHLTIQPMTRRHPGPGEVEIKIYATGLNFRDVLNVLGIYPGDAGPLGSECAGKVTAVGEGVTDLEVGDPVVALATNSFSSYVIIPSTLAVRKPGNMSFEEAATIPIAFLTADYALNTLAKMKSGDRVLIHAATGGVGMAAVQLARRTGAEVFGTAGNPEKRKLLASLGVQHVFNSRTLDFADEVLSITDGVGVDIVLNSLAGDFIPKSLSILKEKGRFVEIGKTEVWDQKQVSEIKSDISYFILYLGEILEKDPLLIRKMLIDLLADFESGKLKPLPQIVYPIEKSEHAFRFMAQAKHTGKIVITQPTLADSPNISADATYLITGGLGGLGLLCAQWLADQGAHHLVLVGRSNPSEQVRQKLHEMEETGTEIHVAQADVSERDDVKKILSHVAENMPPLRGLIHAAGILDDGILLEQTWPRFSAVMAPKVDGVWNLHTLTLNAQLDFFIMFSAGASLLGSPGQSNYATANAFLDGLAHYRRFQGLSALSINWGAWADVGMASKLADQNQRRWLVQGMELIQPLDGMRAMERLLNMRSTQMGVLPIKWQNFNLPRENSLRPLFRLLAKNASQGAESTYANDRVTFLDQLNKKPPEEKFKFLFRYVLAEVNKVLGLDPSHSPNPRQGFTDIGLELLDGCGIKQSHPKRFGAPSSLHADI